MKKNLIIFFFFLTPEVFSSGDWFSQSFNNDQENHYYIGVSEGKENLNEALEEAYQNAIDEALRHNFGFSKQGQKSIQSSLMKTNIDERSFIKTQTVIIKDVRPGRQHVEKQNGQYLVYREVIYPKEAIGREKMRLSQLQQKQELPLNEYGLSGKKLGSAYIRTIPSQAQILLTRVDGRGSVIGTGDAHFRVPLGKYHLTLLKDGHQPFKDTIVISGKETRLNFKLKESLGYLKLDVNPKDAKIYIDNRKAKNETMLPLKVGGEYTVRIEHGDYQTHVQSVSPWINQNIAIENELIPKKGRISILSQPGGADVFIDGQPVGKTPLKDFSYFPDSHLRISVKKEGFKETGETIDLRPNQDHAPLIFTLNKEKKRIPSSFSNERFETIEESSFSLKSLSNNNSKHNLIYNPIISDKGETGVILVPFQYQYYLFRHLALGFDYRYHLENEEVRLSGQKFEKEIVDQVWSVNSTLYFIRNRSFSIGVGPEYTWRKEQIRYLSPGSQARLASFEKQDESFGYKGHVQFGLWDRKNGYRGGLNVDYRRYDLKDKSLGSWSIGLYWEF